MTKQFVWLAPAMLLLAAGCEKSEPAAVEVAAAPAAETCPDDGPRLALTGVCAGRAVNYMNPETIGAFSAPEDCDWTTAETAFPGEGEVLIYQAASCGGVTTKLEFRGGAHSAALGYEASALYADATSVDVEPVRIFGDGERDPMLVFEELKEAIPEAERATCEVRPAGIDGWPSDALVIAPTAAVRATLPQDEPISACGEFGLDEDSQRFWRVSQGYAWFFDLGQDSVDFDPGSLTIMLKGPDGSWSARP